MMDGLCKMAKFSSKDALRAHMISGNYISLLEALLIFGVQNPNAELTRIRQDGYIIGSQRVSMAKIMARINRYVHVDTPDNLPIREIAMTEYWIQT